ncbi:hypothetical protein RHGRI_020677 [Rhododendron griersonianum]|uniref:Uncharacterized protein n=1 Tax=Rhododendron griersonianum TaxID=479676 RepID=A0AAV6JL78_9ERIC|nr:hypothetical protein RHGRI_020677 [Rhododendron griersonianum]
MSSLLEETLAAMHEKDRKRKYSATNGGINKKDTPSALEEPDVEGHFKTKKAKCTENALSDQMTSPIKTNKEKGNEEAKLNASSKRLRKMAANVREAFSRTTPAIDGKNKLEKKLKTNRFDKSQPLKRNANKKPTMEAEPKRADVMATLSNEKQLMLRYVFDHTQSESCYFAPLAIGTWSGFLSGSTKKEENNGTNLPASGHHKLQESVGDDILSSGLGAVRFSKKGWLET